MPLEEYLRDLARQAIATERIPRHKPDRVWAGPGIGAACTICAQPVPETEMEFEARWSRVGGQPFPDLFHFHLRCFAVCELERGVAPG